MTWKSVAPRLWPALLGLPLMAGAAEAVPALVIDRIRLHAGPAAEYPTVAVLERGMTVEVVGCLQGYTWCDILVGPQRGWLRGGFLAMSQYPAQAPLPLPGIGPSVGLPIVVFSLGHYWDSYYRGQPWYVERDRWAYAPPPPPPGPGPGWGGPPPPGWGSGPPRPGWGPGPGPGPGPG
ncbi:SH3 domain-containing protein, partial [Teichococcus deserti]|uniref:SH3 domain-containing protein n=1 Tax=Teichococcus deserti TaxID=1817963 RepID=UPI000D09631A